MLEEVSKKDKIEKEYAELERQYSNVTTNYSKDVAPARKRSLLTQMLALRSMFAPENSVLIGEGDIVTYEIDGEIQTAVIVTENANAIKGRYELNSVIGRCLFGHTIGEVIPFGHNNEFISIIGIQKSNTKKEQQKVLSIR
jgi:transcription elongation GreA/GreB family factor